jgi:hypothetical protein
MPLDQGTEMTERQIGFREILRWLRANLVPMLVLSFVVLQFLTWRELVDLKRYFPSSPPDCNWYRPCYFELGEHSLRQLRPQ